MRDWFDVLSLDHIRAGIADTYTSTTSIAGQGEFQLFVRTKLLVLPVAEGVMPIAAGVVLNFNSIWPVVGIGLIAFGFFAAAYTYFDMIRRCRRGIRESLRDAESEGIFITCPKCNYDLRGSESGTCPECGREPSSR